MNKMIHHRPDLTGTAWLVRHFMHHSDPPCQALLFGIHIIITLRSRMRKTHNHTTFV